MEIRLRTGSQKGWRSYRGRPSDRWHAGLTSLPASLVGEEIFLEFEGGKKKNFPSCNLAL